MQQKFSFIQEKITNDNFINAFKSEIRKLNEKYEIEQESFGIAPNGKASVINGGYMRVRNEFSTLEEALKDFTSINDILYIVDENTIIVGKYSSTILEKKEEEKVVDLSTLKFM